MTERPILFSAPMVRALLAGTKTQTRRAMKTQPSDEFRVLAVEWYTPATYDSRGEMVEGKDIFGVYGDEEGYKCPYGAPGDRLWVRETARGQGWDPAGDWETYAVQYRADEKTLIREVKLTGNCGPLRYPKWTPGIHMPRWASRITLEVTGVRVERLQAISEADATAEGSQEPSLRPIVSASWSERDVFAKLWESINGKGSWAANPWVWVVEFRRA